MLSPGGAAAVTASVACAAALAAAPETQLLGQLSYADGAAMSEPRILSFRLGFSLRTLLRPQPIATPDFGALWGNHPAEAKTMGNYPCAADTAAFMGVLERIVGIAPVQTIGMECIACGKLVGSDHLVLVHGKLGLMAGRALELTVRSKDTRLTESTVRSLADALR